MAKEIKGIDISQHQGIVNWDKIQAAIRSGEIGFVSMRAGYGGGGTDKQFSRNWAEARRRGIPRNAYFFAYPGRSVGVVQAAEFYKIVGPLQAGESIMLDMEDEPTYGRQLVASDVNWAADFLNKANDLFKVKALIYMNSGLIARYDWSRIVKMDHGLWVANYGPNNGKPNTRPGSGEWPFWAIWQFTSRGNIAGISPLDVNIFSGDVDDFLKYGKGGTVSKPKPTPAPSKPAPSKPSGSTYTVQKGDTLSSIAAKYKTTWQKIYDANRSTIGPNPNVIKPGQKLKINGGSGGSSSKKYTVKKGDTLSSIAKKYGTSWQSIYNKNRAVIGSDPNKIIPGQVLAI